MIDSPLGTSLAITLVEAIARRVVRHRAPALLIAYTAMGILALRGSQRGPSARRRSGGPMVGAGVVLAAVGYPLGRWLVGDRPTTPPTDPFGLDLLSLTAVAASEEILWGTRVEPRVGIVPTAILFALKHVAIDGRVRRAPGLFAFWLGLGLVRRHSPVKAASLHGLANGAGVVLGHLTGRDQF